VDYARLAARKDKVTAQLRRGVEALERGHKVTVVKGEASFAGPHTIHCGADTYTAANVVIATGSEPSSIPVPGANLPCVINSDSFLALTKLPKSMVIVGGGVIGIEFATLINSLGVKVSIVEMLPKILDNLDEDLSREMARILTKRGVEIHTSAKLKEVKADGTCIFEEGGTDKQVTGETVLMAVGRRPVYKGLNLEASGVEFKKFITIDEHCATTVPGVYAIGDVTGKIQLAHVATAQGMCAAANIAGKPTTLNYDIVPSCVYTSPEISMVGKTEGQLKKAGTPYKKGFFPAIGNGRSMIMNSTDGFVKILASPDTGEIYGASLMCERATDIVAEIAAVMRAEGTIEELSATIHPHPTVSEMVMEAAHDVEGLSCNKM
jgi:dihydrolipoamide dehydrogenase